MRAAAAARPPVLLLDTDPLMTAAWAEMLFGTVPDALFAYPKADLYLLFAADTPWIEDGTRLFGTAAEKAYIVFGLLVGIAFGPVQASSRSYLARSVSPDEAGRYFGLYALSGRATSFLAPLSVALITTATGSARLGMMALIAFLVVGFLLLLRTPYPAAKVEA